MEMCYETILNGERFKFLALLLSITLEKKDYEMIFWKRHIPEHTDLKTMIVQLYCIRLILKMKATYLTT